MGWDLWDRVGCGEVGPMGWNQIGWDEWMGWNLWDRLGLDLLDGVEWSEWDGVRRLVGMGSMGWAAIYGMG